MDYDYSYIHGSLHSIHGRLSQTNRSDMSGLEIFAVAILAWWTIQAVVPGL